MGGQNETQSNYPWPIDRREVVPISERNPSQHRQSTQPKPGRDELLGGKFDVPNDERDGPP